MKMRPGHIANQDFISRESFDPFPTSTLSQCARAQRATVKRERERESERGQVRATCWRTRYFRAKPEDEAENEADPDEGNFSFQAAFCAQLFGKQRRRLRLRRHVKVTDDVGSDCLIRLLFTKGCGWFSLGEEEEEANGTWGTFTLRVRHVATCCLLFCSMHWKIELW